MLSDDEARRLMQAAQSGDRSAYRLVLGGSRDYLMRYFSSRTPPGMIEDLVQDTLLSLHSKRSSFDPQRAFYPWLAAIARYRWIDALRKLTQTEELQEADALVDHEENSILSRLSLDGLLARIPRAQAAVIILTRISGRSVAETARITRQSENLVKVNVHRGLKKLAALVESE